MLRDKGRILIALRNGESVMLGHVQRSCQNLTIRCQVVSEWRGLEYGRCHKFLGEQVNVTNDTKLMIS